MHAILISVILMAQMTTAQTTGGCAGADPAIISVAVKNVTSDGQVNTYHLSGKVVNLGAQGQASNDLYFVDVYQDGQKVDSRGIQPLRPGQSYTFGYNYKRNVDAAQGSTKFRFVIDWRQPMPPGSQDCNPANGSFSLRV